MSRITSQALVTFYGEASELLLAFEDGLLALEQGADEAESINGLFRAAHTIKGSAGLFGLEPVVRFAHAAETLLEQLRAHRIPLSRDVIGELLAAKDHLGALLEACQRDEPAQVDSELAARLLAHAGDAALVAAGALPLPPPPEPGLRRFAVHVRFGPDVLKDGMDPLSFVRFLEGKGRIESLCADFSRLPLGDAFEPERCYLTLDLEVETSATQRAVEEVFDFVKDTSEVSVLDRTCCPATAAPAPVLPAPVLPTPALSTSGLAASVPAASAPSALPVPSVPAPTASSAPPGPRPSAPPPEAHQEVHTIKVQADKLDQLVNLVGELVIAGATTSVMAARTRDGGLVESISSLNHLIEAIRDSALGLRMVQIGDTFARFRRVVRDVSQQLGKRIELDLRGGDTELDKAMVERLADPLLHLVRNAVDHGIETPEVRTRAGKDEVGHLVLEAFHESGSVVIEVRDDGAGLNRRRIQEKAVEQGLVAASEELDDEQLTELIFRPGFSAARSVTELSGRGVGMDVVRRSIDELRGTIEVTSTEGEGTSVRLRLPLTLAIIDGFLVGVGKASYVVPMDLVRECVDLAPVLESEESHRLDLRGEAVPFIRLRDLFRMDSAPPARQSVVVVEYGERRLGLVVDRLLGASQTVIKPLGALFAKTKGIEGSTILGSGEVALILDVPQISRLATAGTRAAPPAPRSSLVS